MKETEYDIIAAGHLCLDMTPRFETDKRTEDISDLLRPGTLVQMGEMSFSTGGSVSNVGIAMKIFGCRVGFVAKVGGDAIGKIIIEILRRHGSAEGITVSAQESSSYTVVVAPAGIDRIFMHCPGTNDTFSAADINTATIEKSRLFHLGYPTLMRALYLDGGRQLAEILKSVKELGVTTSLDISLPDPDSEAGRTDWRPIYKRCLPYVDLFVPSIEEVFYTLHPERYLQRRDSHEGLELIDYIQPEEFSALADEILDMGCAVAVLKAGHNGWYIKTAGVEKMGMLGRAAPKDPQNWGRRELWCPAFAISSYATNLGAGDSSIAAFLTALLRERTIEESLKLANCAGYLNLKATDTLSSLVSWKELEEAVPTLEVRDTPSLTQPWQWNDATQIWEKK